MKTTMKYSSIATCILFLPLSVLGNWLSFRGDSGNGIIDHELSPSIGLKSRSSWQVKLPGRGLSSPIVVGERVLLTASGPKQETLHVIAYTSRPVKSTGAKRSRPPGVRFVMRKLCCRSNDGERRESGGGAVLVQRRLLPGLEGQLEMVRGLTYDYPNAANGLGMSSSPVIANGVLVAQVENDAESLTVGLNLSNGTTLWKKDRPRGANWTSPTVLGQGKNQQVALQSMKGIAVIDPKTGKDQWLYEDGASTIPSSTVKGSAILVPSNGLTALQARPDGKSHTQLWRDNKLGPGTGSPTISGDQFYVINKANVHLRGNQDW